MISFLLLAIFTFQGCVSPSHRDIVEQPYNGAIEAMRAGSADETLLTVEAAARGYENKNEYEIAAKAYRSAALLAEATGNYQKMLTYAQKSYDLLGAFDRASGRSGIRRFASYLLARAHLAVNDYESVIPLLQKVLPRRVPKTRKQAQIYADLHGMIGDAYQRKRDYVSALRHHEEAFRVQDQIWDQPAKHLGNRINRKREPVRDRYLRHLTSLARDHIALASYRRGIEYGERLLNLAKTMGIRQWEAEAYRLLGDFELKLHGYEAATGHYKNALALEGDQVSPRVRLWSQVGLARAHLAAGKPELAAKDFDRAMEIVENMRTFLETEDIRSSFFEDKVQIYSEAASVQLQLGQVDEGFHTAERARARAFLDLLGTRVTLSRNPELAAIELDFSRKFAALQLEIADDYMEDGRDLHDELQTLKRAYNQFLMRVRSENDEQSALITVQPLTLKQVRAQLEPGQTLLEYFVTTEKTYLWIVNRDDSRVITINASRAELSAKLNRLRQTIANIEPLDTYRQIAGQLYELLILPMFPFVKGNNLIIVPHDVLHYLPFQALNDSSGHYLVQDYALHYLSSASLLKFVKQKASASIHDASGSATGMETVLAIGNPDLDDPKKSLRYAGVEAKEIKTLYPRATVFLEREATEDRAKMFSPQKDILHFASHAELNKIDPLTSAILFTKSETEDGRLEVKEIFAMNLRAGLVVLSACETGLGSLSTGDELVGMTRAFIYAGAPSVVASLWSVEDSSTAQLMVKFYKNLKTMNTGEALRQAQLELIHGNMTSDLIARRGVGGFGKLGAEPAFRSVMDSDAVSTSHPYFWAPFILVGGTE